MNILLIGGGGREHALAHKIASSPLCETLYIAPGNAGTAMHGDNVILDIADHQRVGEFVLKNGVDMVVVGPEEPLVKGLGDHFRRDQELRKVLFAGPGADGARLEGSKAFAKSFMESNAIPTAKYRVFHAGDLQAGLDFLAGLKAPYVLKADGLAAGKGVIICDTLQEAETTLREMLCDKRFGDASETVVIEEYLQGWEMSVFVITDGISWHMLPAAKDYKRIGEGDTGANTGGMGAVSPVPAADSHLMQRIEKQIVNPTIRGLQQAQIPYVGFIFFGLMVVDESPYVIEYNVRLGDPEAEVILPRIKTDLVDMLQAACRQELHTKELVIISEAAATVVLASGGYPGPYQKGHEVFMSDTTTGCQRFYAGVKDKDGHLVTSGGRVMAVTGMAENLEKALKVAYQDVNNIDFKAKYFRRDIGEDLLSFI